MQETWVGSLGQEDPLEEEMATHSSILAWEIPRTEETGGLQSMGSQRVRYHWATESESKSHSVVSDSLRPHGLYSPWNSPGQNTGVGSLSLLQEIFPTQGSNPGFPHCRWILNQLSHKGSLRILEWVAYPFSSRSSRPRNQTGVSCTAGGFFTNWAIRDWALRNGVTKHTCKSEGKCSLMKIWKQENFNLCFDKILNIILEYTSLKDFVFCCCCFVF